MKLLTQNSKMKKSSNDNVSIWNWTLPAYKALDGTITCPNASKCIKGCYAQQGAYIWGNVKAAHNEKLQLTKTDQFVDSMIAEIEKKAKRAKNILIRIHDAGDFYSDSYTDKWLKIMSHFENSNVRFYAYTKEVERFKKIQIPQNFTVIFSFGGRQDHLIDRDNDRHSWVFESKDDLGEYVDASNNDLLALTDNKKVGLVYHGTKSYDKTTWKAVK